MNKQVSNLGINIKRIRESKNISSCRLSKMAHVGISTVSQIETGERQNLNSDTLLKIAKALNVDTEDLLIKGNNKNIKTSITLEKEILLMLSSNELSIDDIKVTQFEKTLIEKYLKRAISVIRIQREDLI